jgi:hypothetical protein
MIAHTNHPLGAVGQCTHCQFLLAKNGTFPPLAFTSITSTTVQLPYISMLLAHTEPIPNKDSSFILYGTVKKFLCYRTDCLSKRLIDSWWSTRHTGCEKYLDLCLTENGTVSRFREIAGHSSRNILPFTVLSKRFFALLMNAYRYKIKAYRYLL